MFSDRLFDPIGWLISKVQNIGIEGVFRRYYGVYRGIVIDNSDPEKRGRVRIMIPSIGHSNEGDVQEGIWALPCHSGLSVGEGGEAHGFIYVPDVKDQVFVMFEKGILSNPLYIGGWVHAGDVSRGRFNSVASKGIRTKAGHTIELDDDGGILISKGDGGSVTSTMISLGANNEVVISNKFGSQVFLSEKEASVFSSDGSLVTVGNGNVTLVNSKGSNVSLTADDININASGNITMSCGGKISLKGSVDVGNGPYEFAMTGDSFVSGVWAGHVHSITTPLAGSPTTPAITLPPVPSNGLSTTVRISK